MNHALENLTIIDLSHFIAGPYCTKLMAGFGAKVIKVERPGTGDAMRNRGPFYKNEAGLERSIPFLWLNTAKKSITLDLKSIRGKDILTRLICNADALIENFSPGVMARLGFDYDCLKKINPNLVMTSISNFGQTGPYKDYKAEEIQLYGMSGLMHETGEPDRPPLSSGPALCQYTAGMSGYIATLIALYHRKITGRGQHVDVSIQESSLTNLEISLVECLQLGKVRKRTGDHHSMVPWELYPCEDGEAGVISAPMRHWRRASEIFDDPRLFDKKYDHCLSRREMREEYEALLKPCVKKHKKRELFMQGQARKLAFTYLADLDEVMDSPQHRSRGFFADIDHPAVGTHSYVDAPFNMPQMHWRTMRSPLLGEHNDDVYGRLLKFTAEEIQHLRKDGVI